jgi:hypothetical protein
MIQAYILEKESGYQKLLEKLVCQLYTRYENKKLGRMS